MDKRFKELLENVKNQILDVFPEMDRMIGKSFSTG